MARNDGLGNYRPIERHMQERQLEHENAKALPVVKASCLLRTSVVVDRAGILWAAEEFVFNVSLLRQPVPNS